MPLHQITRTLTRPDGTIDMPAVIEKAKAEQVRLRTTYGDAYQRVMRAAEFERQDLTYKVQANEAWEIELANQRRHAEWLADNHTMESLEFELRRAFYGTMSNRKQLVRDFDQAIKIKTEREEAGRTNCVREREVAA